MEFACNLTKLKVRLKFCIIITMRLFNTINFHTLVCRVAILCFVGEVRL